MPFLFNFKALLGVLVTLAVLFSIIFFFAFFAILALPILLIIYLFRKKIFNYFIMKKFSNQFYNTNNQSSYNSTFHNNDKDYIEVDYEKNDNEDKSI